MVLSPSKKGKKTKPKETESVEVTTEEETSNNDS